MADIMEYNAVSEIRSKKELFICEQLSQLKSPAEVVENYNRENPNDQIRTQNVAYYKKTRANMISKMREKFLEKQMRIPIAHEKVRLSRMEELYQKTQLIGVEEPETQLKSIETSLKCLKEAREEIKGGNSSQNIVQFNQYNELTPEQLMDKKRELENKFIELSRKEGNIYG